MAESQKDFCFCTLALGQRYRAMVMELATELEKYSSGTSLVILTDEPKEFSNYSNIIAFKHHQQSILHCYNDKRFLTEKALSLFRVAIHIDADTKILDTIPEDIEWKPGITGRHENLVQHVTKNRPHSLADLKKVASKLEISDEAFKNASWIGESLYMVARDGGKEIEFLEAWGKIASYMELRKMYAGVGNLMGLAAAKVGWTIHMEGWDELHKVREHWDASDSKPKPTVWQAWKRRLGYHYRLNRARIRALKDFGFYYR